MEGSGNVRNDLEMCQSGRSEGLTMVVVDKSSKLFLFDGSKQFVEMCQSGRSEGPTMVVVDKSSKLFLFDGSKQFVDSNEQVRGNGVTIKIKKAREGLANYGIIIDGFEEEWPYSQGSDDGLENGESTTFCLNIETNMPT